MHYAVRATFIFLNMKTCHSKIMAAVILGATALAAAQSDPSTGKPIDTERSVLTVRAYKAGLFSAFAHDHEIRAPIQKGTIDEEKNTVEFTVDARTLRVLDPEASEKDRKEIQSTMLGPKVLDSEKFSGILFHSTSIGEVGDDKLIVRGDLTLHGQTHSVRVDVVGSDGHYSGMALLSQKDFGITPISIGGGSIKVKDEIRVEFEIFAK
jgi:polyisoprenoid-binding protein YceI